MTKTTNPTSGVPGVIFTHNGHGYGYWLARMSHDGKLFRRCFPATDAGLQSAIEAMAAMRARVKDADGAASEGNTPSAVNTSSPEETMHLETIDNTLEYTSYGPADDEDELPGITVADLSKSLVLPHGFVPKVIVPMEAVKCDAPRLDPRQFVIAEKSYAREPHLARLFEFASKFDGYLLGTVMVNRRADGSIWVLDGVHRCLIAVLCGQPFVFVQMYEGLTHEEEAGLMGDINRLRSLFTHLEYFNSDHHARKADVLSIESILNEHGLMVASKGRGNHGPNAIESIGTVRAIYKLDTSGQVLDNTLEIVNRAWPGEKVRFLAPVLRAVAEIIITWPDRLRRDRLAERMHDVGYVALNTQVTAFSRGRSTRTWKAALLGAYNQHLAAKNKLGTGLIPDESLEG